MSFLYGSQLFAKTVVVPNYLYLIFPANNDSKNTETVNYIGYISMRQ